MFKNILSSWATTLLGGSLLGDAVLKISETGDWKASLPEIVMGLIGIFSRDAWKQHKPSVKNEPSVKK